MGLKSQRALHMICDTAASCAPMHSEESGNFMYILGIGSGLKHGHHDGSAVLMKDGALVAAAEEERFTLAKHARGELPRKAVAFCLKQAGIKIEDVAFVCSPLISYTNYAERLTDYFKFNFGHSPVVKLYDHHMCHAASTYHTSGFDDAGVVCMDFSGDSASGMIAHGKGTAIDVKQRFKRSESLGLYYGMITQYLGYNMTNDEFKVMGLASYGQPVFEDAFDKILMTTDEGYRFNTDLDKRARDARIYTSDFSTRQEQIFTEELEALLGPRRLKDQPMTQHYINVAASAQRQLEKIAVHLANIAIRETGTKNICIAGGVGLNVKMNMEILKSDPEIKLYAPSVPNDAGVSYGAAILCAVENGFDIEPYRHAYWGPEYSNDAIRHTLTQIGASFEDLSDPVADAVNSLTDGQSIGWFQGRMEFGPRALGNRSILADPRVASVKDRINATIKYREEYRPFCPSVLMEMQDQYFENTFESPFMGINFEARPGASKVIPAVVHTDNSARIQSVNKATNPLYHRLITEFSKVSGVGVLLNTSLNINEQPLVNAPLEALHTYFCSGMDSLYLGNFKLTKKR